MPLHVWWDEPAAGPRNMAADELLAAEALARNTICVRLYGWKPASVSLGGFQRGADAKAEPSIAGVPLVRRPSGGGAIVHGTDLTYAAAVPKTHPCGGRPQLLYDALHEAMCRALRQFGVEAALWRPPEPNAAPAGEEPFFCFDRRSSGDVVIWGSGSAAGRGHKVMGSAQRRLAATVLQHGSLLLRRNVDVPTAASHPGLDDLADARFPAAAVRPLVTAWLATVAATLGVEVAEEAVSFQDEEIVSVKARGFASEQWTWRR